MKHFSDHQDDAGYFAVLITDEPDHANAFRQWLDEHDIAHMTEPDSELDTTEAIFVEPLTYTAKSVLLKLTWGGP